MISVCPVPGKGKTHPAHPNLRVGPQNTARRLRVHYLQPLLCSTTLLGELVHPTNRQGPYLSRCSINPLTQGSNQWMECMSTLLVSRFGLYNEGSSPSLGRFPFGFSVKLSQNITKRGPQELLAKNGALRGMGMARNYRTSGPKRPPRSPEAPKPFAGRGAGCSFSPSSPWKSCSARAQWLAFLTTRSAAWRFGCGGQNRFGIPFWG